MEDDEAWYSCKMCNGKFKTTAELQKHKRVTHRNVNILATTTEPIKEKTLISLTASPAQQRFQEIGAPEHGHGTRYSKAKNNFRKNEILTAGGRHLTCSSCGENFDTKDKVVLHLLRQSRNEAGTIKCPFCVKVLLKGCDVPSFSTSKSILNKKDSTTITSSVRNSANSRKENTTAKDRLNSVRKENSKKSETISSPVSNLSNPVSRPQSSRIKKRKLASSTEQSTPKASMRITSNKESTNKTSDSSPRMLPTAQETASSATVSKQCKPLVTTTTTATVPVQMNEIKRDFETIYRQARGKGSRGGKIGSGICRSKMMNTTPENDERNSGDTPLKVSVLINNNPYPSATRLAIPKSKQFKKGDIKCPYCDFVAQSVREVQFHVNTHMAKSYPCEFCSHIYRSKQGVLKHKEKHHANEIDKTGIFPTDSNNSEAVKRTVSVDDHSSNYSSSFASDNTETENYFYDVSQSQDSTPVQSSYYAIENQNESYAFDQAYFSATAQAIMTEQEREHDLLLGVNSGGGTIEKIVEIANF